MDEQAEKLIVALMVLLKQKEGEIRLDIGDFQRMYDVRHKMGIQVKEEGDKGLLLKLAEMNANPDDAHMN